MIRPPISSWNSRLDRGLVDFVGVDAAAGELVAVVPLGMDDGHLAFGVESHNPHSMAGDVGRGGVLRADDFGDGK